LAAVPKMQDFNQKEADTAKLTTYFTMPR
jgi:hypothetical protein